MTTDLSDMNRQLAEKAGWEYSEIGDCWISPIGVRQAFPPDYTASIDAQHRDLDPLVEAKFGSWNELIRPISGGYICFIESQLDELGVYAPGPKRAIARAAAILEALS